MFEKSNKENKIKAHKLAKEGVRLFNKQFFDKAIIKFEEAIRICPASEIAWYNKGLVLLEQKKYAEAVYCFEKLVDNDSQYQAKARNQIQIIRYEAQIITPEEFKTLATPLEQLHKSDYCTQQYMIELQKLQSEHEASKNKTFDKKISWVITLMEFCFKYYNPDEAIPKFTDLNVLSSASDAKLKRLKIFGNDSTKLVINKYNPSSITKKTDEFIIGNLTALGDDIFLEDSKNIFRMIFETIHQFPREERANLLEFLPWGTGSWYLMEFCSTFFRSTDHDSEVPSIYQEGNSSEVYKQAKAFQESIATDSCLVKAVIRDLLKEDLPKLHQFFKSVEANRIAANKIEPLEDLPNLRILLWYFKHTYQLHRLMFILPQPFDVKTVITCNEKNEINVSPLTSLLLLENSEKLFVNKVKSKLALIRRMQLMGEIFTRRGWGTHVDSIDYIDCELIQDIRNGFTHIEDLHSPDYIYELEKNNSNLIALYKELDKLREALLVVIVDRQKKFTAVPDVNCPFSQWNTPMREYWDSVKLYYNLPAPFNLDAFTPGTPLLKEDKLTSFLNTINRASPHYKNIKKMLHGKVPMKELSDDNIQTLLIESGLNIKQVKKTLKEATREYTKLRRKYHEQKANERRTEERQLKNTIIELMQTTYPHIRLLGRTAGQTLRVNEKMSVTSLIACLQSRFDLLKQIFSEAGLDYDVVFEKPSVDLATNHATSDVELLLSCSYLLGQIIGIMNKLDSLGLLKKIHPDLSDRLPDYIALRNALEHNDPVTDSKDNGFIHMQSTITLLMAQVADELIVKFFFDVMKVKANELTDSPDEFLLKKKYNSVTDSSVTDISVKDVRSKQAAAIDCSHLEYPALPVIQVSSFLNGSVKLFFSNQDIVNDTSSNSLSFEDGMDTSTSDESDSSIGKRKTP